MIHICIIIDTSVVFAIRLSTAGKNHNPKRGKCLIITACRYCLFENSVEIGAFAGKCAGEMRNSHASFLQSCFDKLPDRCHGFWVLLAASPMRPLFFVLCIGLNFFRSIHCHFFWRFFQTWKSEKQYINLFYIRI